MVRALADIPAHLAEEAVSRYSRSLDDHVRNRQGFMVRACGAGRGGAGRKRQCGWAGRGGGACVCGAVVVCGVRAMWRYACVHVCVVVALEGRGQVASARGLHGAVLRRQREEGACCSGASGSKALFPSLAVCSPWLPV